MMYLLVFIFGVFVWPYLNSEVKPVNADKPAASKQTASPAAVQDDRQDRIDYMNFLLTFLATVGTVGGLGFTIFGYYQTIKLPDMVTETVKNEVNERLKEYNRKLDDQIKIRLQALEVLLENAIIAPYDRRVASVSRKQSVEDAAKQYEDLWGLDYYRAIYRYYESDTKEERLDAIESMKKHLEKNPKHIRAHIFLIHWCLTQGGVLEALMALRKLLEIDPDSCYEEDLLRQHEWYEDPDLVKERNRYLYRAEKNVYKDQGKLKQFLDPNHETKLEAMLKELHLNPDLSPERPDVLDKIRSPELYLKKHLIPEELSGS
jgi:tetratricopeptide (TPR) repeat protein